jgi:hypothetical protein
MPLIRSNILEKVAEPMPDALHLQCWEKQENSHSLYVFSIFITNQQELVDIHTKTKRYIATYIQGLLIDKDVERWNLYLVFFVKDEVDREDKYVIEQDRFSTRKIVLDGINERPSDDEAIELIEETLFELTIDLTPIPVSDSIEELLNDKHSTVFLFNESNKGKNNEDIFEDMVNCLGAIENE